MIATRRLTHFLGIAASVAAIGASPVAAGSHWSRTFQASPRDQGAWNAIGLRDGDIAVLAAISQDAWLLRLAEDGTVRWSTLLPADRQENPARLLQAPDDSLVVLQSSLDYEAGCHVTLSGDGQLSRTTLFPARAEFGATESMDDAQPTADGVIVVGDSDGSPGWLGTVRELSWDGALRRSVEISSGSFEGVAMDGARGCLAVGMTEGTSWVQGLVVRLDSDWNVTWSRRLQSMRASRLHDAELRDDGGWVVVGTAEIADGEPTAIVAGISDAGALEWQLLLTRTSRYGTCLLMDVERVADGTFVAVGYVPYFDGLLVRFTASGELLSQRLLGWGGEDYLMSLDVLPDGDLLIAGMTRSFGLGRTWVLRTDVEGTTCSDCGLTRDGDLRVSRSGTSLVARSSTSSPRAETPMPEARTAESAAVIHQLQCFATPPGEPPREVSPPGTSVPLVFTGPVTLAWEDVGCACDAFDVHRGDVADLRLRVPSSCLVTGVPVATATDVETPGIGRAFYYLITCVRGSDAGTPGQDSLGSERIVAACR